MSKLKPVILSKKYIYMNKDFTETDLEKVTSKELATICIQ